MCGCCKRHSNCHCAHGHCCVMVFPPSSFTNAAQVSFAGVPVESNTVVAQKSFEAGAEAQAVPEPPVLKEPKRGRKSNGTNSI